jgi:hypothetical protein
MNSGGAIEMAQRIARTYEPVDKIGAVNVKAVDLTRPLTDGDAPYYYNNGKTCLVYDNAINILIVSSEIRRRRLIV